MQLQPFVVSSVSLGRTTTSKPCKIRRHIVHPSLKRYSKQRVSLYYRTCISFFPSGCLCLPPTTLNPKLLHQEVSHHLVERSVCPSHPHGVCRIGKHAEPEVPDFGHRQAVEEGSTVEEVHCSDM